MENKWHSPLTSQAIAYSWRQLRQRVGFTGDDTSNTAFENLGIQVYYAKLDEIKFDQPSIIVIPCSDVAWKVLLESAPHSLTWLSVHQVVPDEVQLPFDDSVPILFWGDGYENGLKPFAECLSNGSVIFYVDIIATIFFMLSRWEETIIRVRDEHERFPAIASVAYKQGFLDRPIVDEYALIFQAWLKRILPQWQPKSRRFSIKLTHDIDSVLRFPNLWRWLRAIGGDLFKRRSWTCVRQTGGDTVARLVAPQQISHFQGIYTLAQLSKMYGLASAFYFIAAQPGPETIDNDYDLTSSLMTTCIKDLQRQGFEIGLHPSYYTLCAPEPLALEKSRLDAVLGETAYGGRQHFLRFQAPHTWRHWEQVGLVYDSTMSYADHEGFRCGTCHPFRPFDVLEDRELKLWEWPLVVMDNTLQGYRQLTPIEGQNRILELAQRCRQVGGTFVLLWHNNSLYGDWQSWAKVYPQIVKALAELQD